MTAHEGHDHPNTKAARAKCRRASSGPITDSMIAKEKYRAEAKTKTESAATRGEPKPSSRRRVTEPIHTALPHAYDEDMERPGRCYVCKLTRTARIHSEGPRDLSALFRFRHSR